MSAFLQEVLDKEATRNAANVEYVATLPAIDLKDGEKVVSLCVHGDNLFVATSQRVFYLVSGTSALIPLEFKQKKTEGA